MKPALRFQGVGVAAEKPRVGGAQGAHCWVRRPTAKPCWSAPTRRCMCARPR